MCTVSRNSGQGITKRKVTLPSVLLTPTEIFRPYIRVNYGHNVNTYRRSRSPKFIWAPCHVMCTAVFIGWDPATPPPPPASGLICTRGAIGQKRETTSPCNHLGWSSEDCCMPHFLSFIVRGREIGRDKNLANSCPEVFPIFGFSWVIFKIHPFWNKYMIKTNFRNLTSPG